MTDNYEPYNFNEDGIEMPRCLLYKKSWKTYGNKNLLDTKQQIQKFLDEHPLLTIADVEETEAYKTKLGNKILFADDQTEYRELKYRYKIYTTIYYFEPTDDLHEFLTGFGSRKQRRINKGLGVDE